MLITKVQNVNILQLLIACPSSNSSRRGLRKKIKGQNLPKIHEVNWKMLQQMKNQIKQYNTYRASKNKYKHNLAIEEM